MKSPAQGPTVTGRRLTRLMLGYLLASVAVVVLAPFEFAAPGPLEWWPAGSGGTTIADVVLNVVLFVPLGFLADRLGGGRRAPWRTALLGVVVSLAIEVTQLFIPGRYTSLVDVASNGAGAWLGAVGSAVLRRSIGADARLAGRLILELPLVGYLWLMVPLLWLDALSAGGKLPTIGAAAAGGVAIAAAWVSGAPVATRRSGRDEGRGATAARRPSPLALLLLTAGWVVIALVPLAIVDWPIALLALLATLVATTVGMTRFGALRTLERRVEPLAVVAVLVLMLPFLMATTLPGLVPGLGPDPIVARQGILRWLAGVAAFTVIGFLLAEWRGRSPRRWPDSAIAPMVLAALVTALADPGPRIAGRLLPAILASGLGALLFELQRDHVVALRRRRDRADLERAAEVTNLASGG